MTITQVDLDDEALAEAMRLSGVRTKKEMVNLALREYAARQRRVRDLDHFVTVGRTWDYESYQQVHTAEKTPDE